jgi:hypothetical protein
MGRWWGGGMVGEGEELKIQKEKFKNALGESVAWVRQPLNGAVDQLLGCWP